jgi:hypothetical protein
MQKHLLLLLLIVAAHASAGEPNCSVEYERGKREMGAYAEMLGVIEGTIYGHSLTLNGPSICLVGTLKEKVQAIAKALMSDSFAKLPIVMEDVPSREQAVQFLERFFPCK